MLINLFNLRFPSGPYLVRIGDTYERVRSYEMQLIIVEIVVQGHEKVVIERPWHRGDMVLEHVRNISSKPGMVLPP
jgi:hypothetical protein